MAGYAQRLYIQRKKRHHRAEGGAGEETPYPGDEKLRFQLTGSATEAINVHCRKVTRFAGGKMKGQNVKVSVVSMRRKRATANEGRRLGKNEIKF